MKPAKLFFINLAIMFGGSILLRVLAVTIFATIFNAIMGNPIAGDYVTNVFVRLGTMAFNVLAICIPHARDAEARREFLNTLGAEKYDRKADFKALAKSKQFRTECIIFTILYVPLIFIVAYAKWVFPVGILAFPLINLWHHTAVRKAWASERIRLGQD